jgi:hypothetical protein
MEQNRLDLVVGGVRGEDQGTGTEAVGDCIEECVTRAAPGLLEPVTGRRGKRSDIRPAQLAGQAQPLRGIRHEAGVISRIRSEGMVEVCNGEAPSRFPREGSGGMQHGDRVRAARDCEDDGHAIGDAEASSRLTQSLADAGH